MIIHEVVSGLHELFCGFLPPGFGPQNQPGLGGFTRSVLSLSAYIVVTESPHNASTPFLFLSPRTIQMPRALATPVYDFNFFELLTFGIFTAEGEKNNSIIIVIIIIIMIIIMLLLAVDRPNESSCKTNSRIIVSGSSGYLSNLASPVDATARPPSSSGKGSSPPVAGSEACPWTIVVRPGQTVALRVIVLPFDGVGGTSDGPPRRASDYNPAVVGYGCAASFVIREPALPLSENGHSADVDATGRLRRHHYSVCARNSRERHLYTSAGNAVSIHVTSTRFASLSHINRVPPSRNFIPSFIINYEGAKNLTITTTTY